MSQPPPLIGRDAELAELQALLAGAARGVGGCAVLEGPAGIGKSRLLATAIHGAGLAGMAVASARATELDRVAPLNTFLSGLVNSDPPVLSSADLAELAAHSGANRFLIVDRLGERLEEYSQARPLLVALDDLQWADEFTVLVLRILVPRLASSAVLWLLARRLSPEHTPAGDLFTGLLDDGARPLRLGPLPDPAVRELCQTLLGAVPDATVLGLVEHGGGNPFLLEELLIRLRDNGRIQVVDGTATAEPGDLPADFVTAVNRRLGDLSVDARRLLDAGAVLDRPFTVHEVAGLIGKSPAELVTTAECAVDLGILVGCEAELSFRHELIREAVYHRLPAPVRQALHREAASVLRTEGRPAVEIATHLARSARKGDRQAVAVLREAAQEVAATAPSAAADLLLRSLNLVDSGEPIRAELAADAVRLLASAGRVAEAIELGEAAPVGVSGAGSTVLLGLAEALKHAGKHDEVVEYTGRWLDRGDITEADRADLLATRAHALIQLGDMAAAGEAGSAAVELGRRVGAPAAAVSGAAARSVVLRGEGRLAEAVQVAGKAVEIAESHGGQALHRHPGLWFGRALVATDQFAKAESIFDVGRRQAEELGSAWSLPLWHLYLADLQRGCGRLGDAAAEAEAGARVAESLSAHAPAPSLLAVLADIAVRRDDLAAARQYVDRAQCLVIGDFGMAAEYLAWSRALLGEARGEYQSALCQLSLVFNGLPERLILLAQDPTAGPHLVRIALGAGDQDAARLAADAMIELSRRNPGVAALAGAAAHAKGLAYKDIAALRAALQAYRGSPRRLGGASAMEETARAENAIGHRNRAVELLDTALCCYTECGATRDAARVRRRLRRLGVRRRSSPGAGAAMTGWGSLTESELRVARLVAEGMTNRAVAQRLFLSPHTVDSHLRHSFIKLGVSSRVELTRQVLAHDAGAVR
jgi:DNA-binding CsgD family transcriptional regulator/tetratricopeptide (TPR) repeat protein